MRDQSRSTIRSPAPLEAEAERTALMDIGRLFYDRGWSRGTSSNFSVVLARDPLRLLVTATGRDKRCLSPADFVIVDDRGEPANEETAAKPSAETLLHVVAARQAGAGAVLHTHSVWATVLSDLYFTAGFLEITGYEMLKGLAGITTHETTLRLEVFDNLAIPSLADQVSRWLIERRDPVF
jgi:methylthioribulose-1-phosphate dehydratase